MNFLYRLVSIWWFLLVNVHIHGNLGTLLGVGNADGTNWLRVGTKKYILLLVLCTNNLNSLAKAWLVSETVSHMCDELLLHSNLSKTKDYILHWNITHKSMCVCVCVCSHACCWYCGWVNTINYINWYMSVLLFAYACLLTTFQVTFLVVKLGE